MLELSFLVHPCFRADLEQTFETSVPLVHIVQVETVRLYGAGEIEGSKIIVVGGVCVEERHGFDDSSLYVKKRSKHVGEPQGVLTSSYCRALQVSW